MNGNAPENESRDDVWYQLEDEMTEQPKGFVNANGETREADTDTAKKVREAFSSDLIVKDDEVVEELGGVCFDGVCTIAPNDPGHNKMVLRNLGALTGLRPSRVNEPDAESGNPDHE